jgi:hypothetical protein
MPNSTIDLLSSDRPNLTQKYFRNLKTVGITSSKIVFLSYNTSSNEPTSEPVLDSLFSRIQLPPTSIQPKVYESAERSKQGTGSPELLPKYGAARVPPAWTAASPTSVPPNVYERVLSERLPTGLTAWSNNHWNSDNRYPQSGRT